MTAVLPAPSPALGGCWFVVLQAQSPTCVRAVAFLKFAADDIEPLAQESIMGDRTGRHGRRNETQYDQNSG
jgi:hypothetical protein